MIINKDELIGIIAKTGGLSKTAVQKVHKAFEKTVFNLLSSVNPDNDKDNPLIIKLWEGLSIEGYYSPEHEKKMNYDTDGVSQIVKSRIKTKANITRNYNRKLLCN